MSDTPHAPGITFGYIIAAAVAAGLWLGVGIVMIPVMLVIALLHRVVAPSQPVIVNSHHRWLARHHLLSAVVLVGVLIAPFAALPTLLDSARTVLNTLAYAPHPIATLEAAWPQLGVGQLVLAGFVVVAGWLLATLWISIRVIRHWLRWAEGRPA